MNQPSINPPIAISTKSLSKAYGEFKALSSLDLQVFRGEIFGLLGPNGAGKSTAIKILTTLLEASDGEASVAGYDVIHNPVEVRRHIGYVPQLLSADGGLTARENLQLSARLYGLGKAQCAQRIVEAIEFSGLHDFVDNLVKTFSGGMIRRLEIAQATMHYPDVLFLDEPTIGLDPIARRTVWERLQQLQREKHMTILITTHDMEEADVLCNRLAILHEGKLAVTGTPGDLKAQISTAATLSDVFAHYSGVQIDHGGNYLHVRDDRQTATRLG